ncbi:MAG: GGDEF and EAL domain-containing protein [Selenomonadaceae bacterium]|nr:GGDEF and EAL domain-containing protein [Selenomonadaceae bacterium]
METEPERGIILAPDENHIPTGLPGGFFVYNALGDQEIYFADQNVIELFGCTTIEELREHTGNSFRGMVHPEDLDKIESDIMSQTFNSEKQHDYVRYRITTKQGEVRYIEDFGHLLHGEGGQKIFYVYIVDVDKDEFYNRGRNSFAESQIFSMNRNADRLTGLLNMSAFYEAVQEKIASGVSSKEKPLTFIHFDIVNFKIFNENYGFQKGDDLLCRMAYTIRREFPGADVARFSNDHFMVCTDLPHIVTHVENIHSTMLRILDGIRVEIKAGIYKLEETCKEVGLACDHARIACNMIKRRYDKVYGVYEAQLYERLRMQQYVLDNIDIAVEKEYLKVFYQPIIRVETGKICGYEALARWDDPKAGMLSPATFIVTLEEGHMIHKVDTFVIKKVCEDLCRLMEEGKPVVPVSVNLSRLDFELCEVFELTEHFRRLYNLPRDLIDIEITESALNEDSSHLQREVQKFRSAGYHIWIDDFGSGYSSLNHLMSYEFDVLKLDLEFMRTYDKHPRSEKLLRHLVQAALELGIQPLQEGVETAEHFEFLKTIGCKFAQGYYFAKPLPIEKSREFTQSKGLEWE